MNELREYFENNPGRLIHKWMHYFDIYERHLARYRNRDVTLVELGVFHGGSLQMWKHYLGDGARIVGVDIDARCKTVEEDQIEVRIGDQADRGFLQDLRDEFPAIDVLIDDGGHTMEQQIVSMQELYAAVVPGGTYIVEDVHTSYIAKYGGGRGEPGTMIELSKALIDELNGWYSDDPDAGTVTDYTRSTLSMHYYDSVIVFEKGDAGPPVHRETGALSF